MDAGGSAGFDPTPLEGRHASPKDDHTQRQASAPPLSNRFDPIAYKKGAENAGQIRHCQRMGALLMQSSTERGVVCTLSESLDADARTAFEDFVRASPGYTYQQSALWPSWAPVSSLQHFRYLTAQRDGMMVAAAVVRFTRLAPKRFLASLMRGPVVRDVATMSPLLPALAEAVADAGACSILLNPCLAGEDALTRPEIMRQHGFAPTPPSAACPHRDRVD